jgi:hypothetical protein
MAIQNAIPTKHDGIVYRSRTEARWAEFFRLTHTPVVYEPDGFKLPGVWYVPDFILSYADAFFEVKGGAPTLPEREKASKLAKESSKPVIVACGNPSAEVVLLCFTPEGSVERCVIVEEHKGNGAWVAEFVDGGGWAFPMRKNLVNCAAYGHQHPTLEKAAKVQFNAPDLEPPPYIPDDKVLGDWEIAGRWAWRATGDARRRMKQRGDK